MELEKYCKSNIINLLTVIEQAQERQDRQELWKLDSSCAYYLDQNLTLIENLSACSIGSPNNKRDTISSFNLKLVDKLQRFLVQVN